MSNRIYRKPQPSLESKTKGLLLDTIRWAFEGKVAVDLSGYENIGHNACSKHLEKHWSCPVHRFCGSGHQSNNKDSLSSKFWSCLCVSFDRSGEFIMVFIHEL